VLPSGAEVSAGGGRGGWPFWVEVTLRAAFYIEQTSGGCTPLPDSNKLTKAIKIIADAGTATSGIQRAWRGPRTLGAGRRNCTFSLKIPVVSRGGPTNRTSGVVKGEGGQR